MIHCKVITYNIHNIIWLGVEFDIRDVASWLQGWNTGAGNGEDFKFLACGLKSKTYLQGALLHCEVPRELSIVGDHSDCV